MAISVAKKYSRGKFFFGDKVQNEALSLAAFRVVNVAVWCVH